jgi:hypothetical protein
VRSPLGRPLALAALLLGCSGRDSGDSAGASTALSSSGPDPIILRVPRDGGIVSAFRYPKLDSAIWKSTERAPSPDALLAFDQENGVLAYLDENGAGGWIDLRVGTVRQATKKKLTLVSSADGWSIFGVGKADTIVRITPTGEWEQKSNLPVRRLYPQPDGTLLYMAARNEKSMMLRRVRPPEAGILDSVELGVPQRAVGTPIGDRLYFGLKSELIGVPTSGLDNLSQVRASDEILAIAPTPSGDRIFVASNGNRSLEVIDRYSSSITGTVRLPGFVTELRMDPLGRFLLARPVAGDSAWVVAIGSSRLVGSVATDWRTDVPFVSIDGTIATIRGDDIFFVDPTTGATKIRVPDGASDAWTLLLWNGFRPRAKGLDQPMVFQSGDTAQDAGGPRLDTFPLPPATTRDSSLIRPPSRMALPDSTLRSAPNREREGFIVQFASLLSEERARSVSSDIRVDGQHPRVVTTRTEGTPVYRVILGPYPTRADAERAGKASGHSFWIIEGIP